MITEMEIVSGMQALARQAFGELGRRRRDQEERERERERERARETEKEPMRWLTAKFVLDWLFRPGSWKGRARLVAREFKGTQERCGLTSHTG